MTLTKPDLPVQNVGLSLGSNQGDRFDVLNRAMDAIHNLDGVELDKASSFYETAPWGVEDQASFINVCVIGKTSLDPNELMQATQSIENEMGRVKTIRWGPRLIDIDILYLGDSEISDDHLTIPHAHMLERSFVLIPLVEIAPTIQVRGVSVSTALSNLEVEQSDCVVLSNESWTPKLSTDLST